ncbi:hypothetical protein IWQ60_008218, partial [Tieghemiomyces parasiticus]
QVLPPYAQQSIRLFRSALHRHYRPRVFRSGADHQDPVRPALYEQRHGKYGFCL